MKRLPEQSEPDESLPEGLRDDLSALYRPRVAIPPEVDRAIWALARRELAWRRYRRWAIWGGWGAAAGLLLAAWVTVGALHPRGLSETQVAARGGVYQRSGDILDAFYLARQLKTGAALGKQWDVNGDGVVDQGDVEALAVAAVALKRGAM